MCPRPHLVEFGFNPEMSDSSKAHSLNFYAKLIFIGIY